MERRDRRQDLVAARPLISECALEDRDTLGDLGGVPTGPVLLVERHEPAVCGSAGRQPGVLEQHQRQQPARLRLRCGQQELASEANRLAGQLVPPAVPGVIHERQDAKHHGEITGFGEAATSATSASLD